jgi:adenine-specific DNA-methyltransferase
MTNPGDLVVDPFMGVGSTAVAAVLTGRRAAGSDLDSTYIDEARNRVRRAFAGNLPVRQNRPIFKPNGNEAVARVPEGFWLNFGQGGGD